MLILTIVIGFVLFFTRWGLRVRAVGEHPRAADTLGIDVIRIRYINVLVGGLIAGLAGAWFTLEAVDVFNPIMTNGLGFIGLAAMIFGKWNPFGALLGALIFGLGNSVTTTISIFRPDIPSQIPQMLPYILTIIVLTGVVGRARASGRRRDALRKGFWRVVRACGACRAERQSLHLPSRTPSGVREVFVPAPFHGIVALPDRKSSPVRR